MNCPNCHINKAQIHKRYAILACKSCLTKQQELLKPHRAVEITTAEIKESRKIYYDDVLQPHRKGQLSKEWVEAYGQDAAKHRGFSEKEIQQAQYVWSGDDGVSYYKRGN